MPELYYREAISPSDKTIVESIYSLAGLAGLHACGGLRRAVAKKHHDLLFGVIIGNLCFMPDFSI